MSSLLTVEWTIRTRDTKETMRHCARCAQVRPFGSTEKFRLNANGRRLDAWLIYRCQRCGRRWNRPFLQRVPVASLSKDMLEQLQSNNLALAERIAHRQDFAAAQRPKEVAAQYSVEVKVADRPWNLESGLNLLIRNPEECSVRLDRLLANGMRLPRRTIGDLFDHGALALVGASERQLRKALPEIVKIKVRHIVQTGDQSLVAQVLSCWKKGGS